MDNVDFIQFTTNREIAALLKAGKELKCKNLLVITEDKEGEETFGKNKIGYLPLWKYLLYKQIKP